MFAFLCGESFQPKIHATPFQKSAHVLLLAMIGFSISAQCAESWADDWPTYRHDQRRSGIAGETLEARRLVEAWSWRTSSAPSPAWPDSAKWDAYAKLEGLRSMRNYDPVLHPVIAGGALYLPGNHDDTVRCFDLATGELRWHYTADGPVRIAPTIYDGLVYFGSDDGFVYALSSQTGKLVWRTEAAPGAGLFVNDGRLISMMPVRSGVLIDPEDQTVVVSAGLFPWRATLLQGLDLATGEQRWQKDLGRGWTIEGSMLLSAEHLVAPQGRAAPQLFQRHTGESAGALPGGGGSFVILTDDDQVLHGPGNKGGWITASSTETRKKIASFDKGTAVVVRGDIAFLLNEAKLAAFQRESGTVLWSTPCPCPHDLVLAGDRLFAGGDDQVLAFDAKNGVCQWRADVKGRAQGLAVANGRLIVSTDRGFVHVFAPTGEVADLPDLKDFALNHAPTTDNPAPEPVAIDDPDLLDRWVFHANQLEEPNQESDQGSFLVANLNPDGRPAALSHGARIVQAGQEHALNLDGATESEIAADFKQVPHPKESLTVEAWVRIDEPTEWGGLLSMTQDNGSFEKGWILGYRKDRFGFALNGAQGPDRLTWLTDQNAPFSLKTWHHVAATYDGNTTRLYVDGRQVAESAEQQGAIQYPPRAAYHLGAYKDDDEHYIAKGMLNEVRLYRRALPANEIKASAQEKKGRFPEPTIAQAATTFPPDRGPILRFIEPGTAEVVWWTNEPQVTHLDIVDGDEVIKSHESAELATQHRVVLSGVRRDALLHYRIVHQKGDAQVESPLYECDGHFDYTRTALPDRDLESETAKLAQDALAAAHWRSSRGLAIVYGCGNEGQFAEAIARLSGCDVVALDDDADRVTQARQRLIDTGIYGRRISVKLVEQVDQWAAPPGIADLILIDDRELEPSRRTQWLTRLNKVVRPGGAVVTSQAGTENATPFDPELFQPFPKVNESFLAFRKQNVEGSAAWTHMYGTPDNSAYAGETLSGARSNDDLRIAWAGRPGPRYQADRGNRKPSPLAAGGRLYMQGLHRIISLNAHNGTILWSLELPEVIRFNVPRDCSNWCADDARVYVAAKGRCLVLNGATGKIESEWDVYNPGEMDLHWGYIARHEDLVLGSGVHAQASFSEYWGGEHWYDAKDGEHANKVCSDVLFARDARQGGLQWTYRNGLIVNPTITVADGRVHFVECRSEDLSDGDTRRLGGDEFWNNLHLVALDAETGNVDWEIPARPMPGETAMYLVASQGKLVLQTSQGGAFAVYAFDATNGEQLWRGKYDWETNHHGKHLSRPAIVEGKIYLRPLTLDLADGTVLAERFPSGHQCGTYTASRDALFLRAGNLAVWDRHSGKATRWERARPDCWISTIPALGMLLSPEGGGGCSCGGWIETSMGFVPVGGQP